MKQQMVNVYEALGKVLAHYGVTFPNVIVENVFMTDILKCLTASAYRNSIYKVQFPTVSCLEGKGLTLPEFTKAF